MKTPFDELFYATDQKYGLPRGMTKSVAAAETGHIKDWGKRTKAKSPAGAVGLMQFMPETGKRYGLQSYADLIDPFKSIDASGRYLADISRKLGTQNPLLIAAGYNAGENRQSLKEGRIPAIPETQKYVQNVDKYLKQYGSDTELPPVVVTPEGSVRGLPGYGVNPIMPSPPAKPATTAPVTKATPYDPNKMTIPDWVKALKPEEREQLMLPPGYGDMGMAKSGFAGMAMPEAYQDMSAGMPLQSLMQMILGMRNARRG